MKHIALGVLFAAMFTGCAAIDTPVDDGYEFGDTLDSIIVLQAKYCAETNPVKRSIYLKAVKSLVPFYPERGACTDLAEVVGGMDNVGMIAKGTLDVSEATSEQEKYKEYLENQQEE